MSNQNEASKQIKSSSSLGIKFIREMKNRSPDRRDGKEFGKDDYSEGWRIHYENHVIPMAFKRKQDAEIALNSIKDFIDWSGTVDEVFDRLKEAGLQNLRRKMTECLRW